jgi:hypothetical protein
MQSKELEQGVTKQADTPSQEGMEGNGNSKHHEGFK